jgi:hypothetical protein
MVKFNTDILRFISGLMLFLPFFTLAQIQIIEEIPYKIYPEVNEELPDLPSPFINGDGNEYIVAITKEKKYAIIDVTLSNDRGICKQLIIDTLDFPSLVTNGLHDKVKLANITEITGWTLDTITQLGRPEGLSHSGFMAADEDILSVLTRDNELVKQLGFTHPQLAKPLFQVLNLMDVDLDLNRWNMAKHQWENIQYFLYNGHKVDVIAYDTKGGQKSIFNDELDGAFHVQLWRDLSEKELAYLKSAYQHLSEDDFEKLVTLLSFINVGEMQPQYIMRYGFYEGHTFWRAEPIAISFIFGMKSLEDLDSLFGGHLDQKLLYEFTQ